MSSFFLYAKITKKPGRWLEMYKKILVPIDGSDSANAALKHAVQLAEIVGAEITLFHVMHIPAQVETYSGKLGEAYYLMRERIKEYAEEILEKAKEEFASGKVAYSEKKAWGEPANEIIQEEKEGGYDLVVIGSRGLGEIKGWLLGSVSQRVVRHSKCPVLVVR
ncbi:MAG: universal stress protein [Desulfotomaculales bacterium]